MSTEVGSVPSDLLDEYNKMVRPVILRVNANAKITERVIDLSVRRRMLVFTMPEDSTKADIDDALGVIEEALEDTDNPGVLIIPGNMSLQVIDL